MLKVAESGWLAAADGRKLFYRNWPGKTGEPVVVYLHGVEGHSGWFAPTAERLQDSGFNLYAPDRRGAGMNDEDRGHLREFPVLLDDIRGFLAFLRKEHPTSQLFLLGNCWGAKAAALLAGDGERLNGLILTSPALKARVDVPFAEKLRIALAYFSGSMKQFDLPIRPEMFTGQAEWLEFIRKDPQRLTRATAAFLVETLKLRWFAQQAAEKISLPLLMFQAGHDDIADTTYGEAWFRRVSSTDKTLKTFSDSAHTIDFDLCADEYANFLVNWVRERSAGGKS
jgi:lysophospholipase